MNSLLEHTSTNSKKANA